MMKKHITHLFSLLTLLVCSTSFAEQKLYNVELVVFEDISGRYINSEQWPVIHQTEEELIISPDSEKNIDANITYKRNNSLAGHITKLEKSPRYNVLLHQSWQQAGLKESDAISIEVNANTMKNIESFDQEAPKSKLEGKLKLILGRYLHIHADLLYKRLNDEQLSGDLTSTTYSEFKIKFQRRMRSKELHYIDHPLIGMLVIVKPIEIEKEIQSN